MSEFFESGAKRCRFFGVMEKGAKFRLGGRGQDHFHDGGKVKDGAV